jgi:diacylglycerol O-acyltransferase / wax synthase
VVRMTDRRTVGAVDTIWLNMDRPNNLMVIDAVMWFEELVDWDRLVAVLQHRLVDRYPVFREHPVDPTMGLGWPHWEVDPDFQLSRHMVRATLPPPGDTAALQEYIEAQIQRPLDREHPLWEFHLVDGYLGGSAILARFHHALADGIALAEVLLSLTDATPTGDLEAEEPDPSVEEPRRPSGFLSLPFVPDVRNAAEMLAGLPHLARPSVVMDALTLTSQTGHILNKLLLGSNPTTPLSGRPGIEKRAVWSSPRPVAAVKRVGQLAGATVNDVLVGAVTGAMTAYVVEHGGEAADLTTMVPVNLRPTGQPLPRELGNKFALVLLSLPIGARTPLARLTETKRRMDSIKTSPEAVITFGLINAIGRTQPRLEKLLVDFFSSKAIGVTTNVMGPLKDRYIAGSRITGVLGWVPGSGHQTVGVSIFTYNRMVRVGFKVDATVVPDPERLIEAFDQEMDDLERMARAV